MGRSIQKIMAALLATAMLFTLVGCDINITVSPSQDPSAAPTTPTTPAVKPTEPSTPSTTPTTPEVKPTEPSTPSTTPTTPEVKPTEPSTPSTTPTTPEVKPTEPSTPSTTPSTPEVKPTEPSTPSTTPTTPGKLPIDRIKALPADMKEPSYKTLVEEIELTGSVFAEAFIGYVSEPMRGTYADLYKNRGYMEFYPFLSKITPERYVKTEGNEVYCIVPKSRDCSVTVTEWSYSQKTGFGRVGAVLYESDYGDPIIITCNGNDLYPNTQVTLKYADGSEYSFNPVLDQNKEWLLPYESPEGSAYDFTVYRDSTNQNVLSIEDLQGDWSGEYLPGDGRTFTYHFNFYTGAYGECCAEFWYGENGKETYEYYEGYAYKQFGEDGEWTGNMILEMYLTRGTASAIYGEDYFCGIVRFIQAADNRSNMIASVNSDENLMRDFGLNWFECEPVMG